MRDLESIDTEIDGVEAIDAGLVAVGGEPDARLDAGQVTRAPAITAPEASRTVPVTVPRLVWDSAAHAQATYPTASFHVKVLIFACLHPRAAK